MCIELSDIIYISATVFSFILAYLLFRITEKRKEKQTLTDLFKKFKNDIETFFIGGFFDKAISSFESVLPLYRSQQDKFMKLGMVIRNSKDENMYINESYNMWITTLIVILNKYYVGIIKGSEHKMNIRIQTLLQQNDLNSVEELECMLKAIIDYTKINYGIKINKKLADLSKYNKTWAEIWEEEAQKTKNKENDEKK